jgi:queuosine precursor transporter
MILIALYILTIPAANWLIGNFGTVCIPQGPCLIPVLPGIMAPSGVLMIGAALLLRDLVQRRYGPWASIGCIAAGAALSFFVAVPALAVASGAAFLLSEFADFTVYTPLAKRQFALAVMLSCLVGAAVDSALFLWLAFGSLDHLTGQIIGKAYAAMFYLTTRKAALALRRRTA